MKNKYLLAALLIGAFSSLTANAQSVIYISGAPAARVPFSTAINRLLTTSTNAQNPGPVTVVWSGTNTTTLTTANALTWYGGNINGVPVTVKVSYVGSSAGIQDVAANSNAKFLPSADTVPSTTGTWYPEPNTSGNANDSELPNFTASDEFQASTPWQGTNSLTGVSTVYQQLDGQDIVGVLPYRWVTNTDAPARLNNITPKQAQVLFRTGSIYLSQLTGTNTDENLAVYAIGRDIGSGLRTVLLSETAIGVQTGIQQYQPTVSGTPSIITSQVLYPAETVNGVSLPLGDGGYSSFSGLQADLAADTNSNGATLANTTGVREPGYYVTALADSDAQTVLHASSPGHEVAWNGNFLGTLGTYGFPNGLGSASGAGSASYALAEGQYTFWSYLQLQYQTAKLSSSVNPNAYNFEQALVNDLRHTDSTVLLKDLAVYRTQDGGQVFSGNPYQGL